MIAKAMITSARPMPSTYRVICGVEPARARSVETWMGSSFSAMSPKPVKTVLGPYHVEPAAIFQAAAGTVA
jgi:hypothetical protein